MIDSNIEVLKELRKMNKFLEAIDWKLWNLHQQVMTTTSDEEQGTEEVAEGEEDESSTTESTSITKPVPKYPSIEIIK